MEAIARREIQFEADNIAAAEAAVAAVKNAAEKAKADALAAQAAALAAQAAERAAQAKARAEAEAAFEAKLAAKMEEQRKEEAILYKASRAGGGKPVLSVSAYKRPSAEYDAPRQLLTWLNVESGRMPAFAERPKEREQPPEVDFMDLMGRLMPSLFHAHARAA